MDNLDLPTFGAVYFRKTNPPKDEWERDFKVAAEDGMKIFRHWAPWGAVEVAPGVYDWADYDRILELSDTYGIKAVLAELITNAPEWIHFRHPEARRESRDGRKRPSMNVVSCATGGAHSMCLDNEPVEKAAEGFLRSMASRYRDNAGLFGYDIWNECSLYNPDNICHCPATEQKFRDWAKRKYGDLKNVAEAWHKYSFTDWAEVRLPREVSLYPDVLDAIDFQIENTYAWMKWRVDILKSEDRKHPVLAHGNAKSYQDIAPACGDDWRAGELVDIFGYTYWYANRAHTLLASDMIRSASRGKTFWRAEAIGGPEWIDRRIERREPEKDEMAEPENIRLDALISLMAGSRSYQNPRWRSLLDGQLFGAYGWYANDGSRTDRSAMVKGLAEWSKGAEPSGLWKARPVKGDVAVVLCEEAQAFCYAFYGKPDYFSWSLQGAGEAFMDASIQCDIIKPDQIADYDLVYLPFPVALREETLDILKRWVEGGGKLVAEACFGYLNGFGHVQEKQPNRGFAEVFGCTELDVSLAPDRWTDLHLNSDHGLIRGSLFRQSFIPTSGRARGWFDDGAVAEVENSFGRGRVRVIGTMPSYAYKTSKDSTTREWFVRTLEWAGKRPLVRAMTEKVVARLWKSDSQSFLWILNQASEKKPVTVEVDLSKIRMNGASVVRGERGAEVMIAHGAMTTTVGGRDAVVLRVE